MPLPTIQYPDWNRGLAAYGTGFAQGQAINQQSALAAAGKAMAAGDTAGARNALYEHGQFKAGMALDQHLRTAARQANADQLAKTARFNATLGNLARLADTPEKWNAAISNAAAAGLDVEKYRDFGTRDFVIAQAGMAADIIGEELKRKQLELKMAGGTSKPPTGYRWAQGGALEAIPGGPATKLSGEVSGRLALMRAAKADLDQAKQFFKTMGAGPWGRVSKALNMGEAGVAERTVKSSIEAVLRALTGAAATEDETQRYLNIFGPSIYDNKRTRADKLRRLEDFMNEAEAIIMQGHGAAPMPSPQLTGPAQEAAPSTPQLSKPVGEMSDEELLKGLGLQ